MNPVVRVDNDVFRAASATETGNSCFTPGLSGGVENNSISHADTRATGPRPADQAVRAGYAAPKRTAAAYAATPARIASSATCK